MSVALLLVTLTFPDALERAMRTQGAAAHYDQQARVLEALSARTLPTVRAEAGFSSAEDLNLITQSIDRFDAFTAIVAVDYPLLRGGSDARRIALANTDAQLLRRRAREDAERVFQETLDAFARLYTAEARIELLHDGGKRATDLRERARTMLEGGQISHIVAAQWQDQALVTESQLVDLELQRLEAETRLKQLIGDTSPEALHASLQIENESAIQQIAVENDPAVAQAALQQQRKQLALLDALALRRPQVSLSAFGGIAALPGTSRDEEGTFGMFGLRVSMSLPMFDGAMARRVAEARMEAEEAIRVQHRSAESARHRFDLLRLNIEATDKRVKLMQDAVDVSRRREESVSRLVLAGVRPEADLLDATNATARRESELLAVRVERWKLQQQVKWAGGGGGDAPQATTALGH